MWDNLISLSLAIFNFITVSCYEEVCLKTPNYPIFGLSWLLSGKESACNTGDQETRVWSLGWEDLLEEEMATHSSILAWEISWAEESGSLQSMESERVRHDWGTKHKFKGVTESVSKLSIITQHGVLCQQFKILDFSDIIFSK